MKLLVLLSRVPYPIEKGDKLRAFNQLKCLSEKFEIILCALSDAPIHPQAKEVLSEFCSEIHFIHLPKSRIAWNVLKAFFNGKPLQVGYFYNCKAKREIDAIIRIQKPDHIYCQLIRTTEYARDHHIPKTLDYQDAFSVGFKRQKQTAGKWWLKPILEVESKRLKRYENEIFDCFDGKTIISKPDRDLVPHLNRHKIKIVPNGVNIDYFHPMDLPEEYDLVFIGNMNYPPNVNAAEFLAKDIFPLVLKKYPTAKLLLAGATPHAKVKALESGNITVSGWVDDIRTCYASSKIFIAPMQIGTGLQNKLLEAMAMQIPCITSPLANDALGAKENEEILLGKTPQDFADQIFKLIENEKFAQTLAQNGNHFVKQNYIWEKATEILETEIRSTTNQKANTNL